MKRSLLLGAAAATFVAFAAGCGAIAEAEPAAYPQTPGDPPIGYDNPSSLPPPVQRPATPPPEQLAQAPEQDVEMGAAPANEAYEETDPSALSDFKGTLDPYGQWVDDSQYGTVWVPSESVVGSDFAPYQTAGHWTYDNEYTWVSDYSWGWAPFHYGRWTYIGHRGWGWIPGRRYAGAWVAWRTGDDGYGYVGWAPLAPTWYWRGGAAYSLGFYPTQAYAFCPTGALFNGSLRGHIVAGPHVGTIAAGTRQYVPAHPGVGGGPTPNSLHIPANAVVAPPAGHGGIAQARNFAHPSSAVAMGGHAPAGHVSGAVVTRTPGSALSRSGAGATYHGNSTYAGGHGAYSGGYSRSYPSYGGYGGRSSYYGGSSHYSTPHSFSRNPVFRGPGSGVHAPTPSYHPPASTSTPHSSGGSFRGGSRGGGGGRHR